MQGQDDKGDPREDDHEQMQVVGQNLGGSSRHHNLEEYEVFANLARLVVENPALLPSLGEDLRKQMRTMGLLA